MAVTTCRYDCQSIGNSLVHLLLTQVSPVKLMEYLSVLDKQDATRVGGRPHAVGHHHNRLPLPVDLLKQF